MQSSQTNNVAKWNLRIPLLCLAIISPLASAQVVITYTYDDLNRLRVVDRDDGPTVTIVYDEVGNITSNTVTNSPDTNGDGEADFADDDDDGDHIPDTIEIFYGLNPLLDTDAAMDLDGDGISNLAEYQQGSDLDYYHGDLSGDGSVDISDVLLMQRVLYGIDPETPDLLMPGHADVNLNGELDLGDLIIIQKRALER